MKIAHEEDYQRRFDSGSETRFLPGSTVEIIRTPSLREPPQCALFDFDGTLSLIREGWTQVMVRMMVDALQQTRSNESVESLTALVTEYVTELTGKQTIYQMIRLAKEVEKRGGSADDPADYKRQYHERLMQRIHHRREALRNREVPSEQMLVPFAITALESLRDRGVKLYLASGTDQDYVREESRLLGLDTFFGAHIYGALDDHANFSKQMVIERIMKDCVVDGSRLIGFGDGYVEIANLKSAGAVAIAVASDESGRSGRPDPWKRDRLIGVGADIVIPDFRDFQTLFAYIWDVRPTQ